MQVKTDGTVLSTLPLDLPSDDVGRAQLAIAPDGRHMVLAVTRQVQFLDAAGKMQGRWMSKDDDSEQPGADGWMVQPAFAPDGKSIAMKWLARGEADLERTRAIVFFSPEGKELSRVAIPPLAAPRP